MFLKRKKTKPDITILELTNRLREFILDSQVPHGHEISEFMGCSPISDEVAMKEEEESDKRLAQVDYLLPLMYAYSHTLIEGALEHQRNSASEHAKDIPEIAWQETRKTIESLVLNGLMGSISQMVDLGLLDIPKKFKE